MLYSFRADIAPINSSLFIRFEIGSNDKAFYRIGAEKLNLVNWTV